MSLTHRMLACQNLSRGESVGRANGFALELWGGYFRTSLRDRFAIFFWGG
jgi:hypothetical protein